MDSLDDSGVPIDQNGVPDLVVGQEASRTLVDSVQLVELLLQVSIAIFLEDQLCRLL